MDELLPKWDYTIQSTKVQGDQLASGWLYTKLIDGELWDSRHDLLGVERSWSTHGRLLQYRALKSTSIVYVIWLIDYNTNFVS